MKNPKVGIGVFVVRHGKFLIGLRVGTHGKDTWSIPGGHLEYGESFEETAKREVREEVGIEVDNVRFGAVTNDIFADKHYISIWVICDYKSGELTVTEPDKFIEHKWINFTELQEPLFLPWKQLLTSPFIENIKKEVNSSKVNS